MNNDQENNSNRPAHKNAGNFANNRQRAAEAGRKGGQASRGGGRRPQNSMNDANASMGSVSAE